LYCNVASNLKLNETGKNIKSKLELKNCAVVSRSSRHGLDVPGTGYLGACAVIINQVLTTARRQIVCGRAARPFAVVQHDRTTIDCVVVSGLCSRLLVRPVALWHYTAIFLQTKSARQRRCIEAGSKRHEIET